jgi:hypothetical protein
MPLTERPVIGWNWPLQEQQGHFDLGHVFNCVITDAIEPVQVAAIGPHHAGLWECDLADQSLTWSGGVYDLFGLPRGGVVTRDQAVAHYREDSRAKLERLRTYAICHRAGFTLDAQIRAAAVGEYRHVRLVAAPLVLGDSVIRIHGLKLAL